MFEGVPDLLSVLRLTPDRDDPSALPQHLQSDPGRLHNLVAAADRYLLLSAVLHQLSQGFRVLEGAATARNGAALQLVAAASRLTARRLRIEQTLKEVIGTLNKAGIVPMLLKGSACLWTGEPAWRYQRDIDILVSPAEAEACQSVLQAAGFYQMPDQDPAPHHLHPLVRDGLPVGIEVHFAVSNPRAERYLPSREFWHDAIRNEDERGTVLLPGPVQHLLHMVIHNHFSHRNSVFGVAPLKGLYEFAWTMQHASSETVMAMHERASRNPALLAAVDLWLAAAVHGFGASLTGLLAITPDATARWTRLKERTVRGQLPSLMTALREEHAMIRARSNGMDSFRHALITPVGDILTAPIWTDWNGQALKSAGVAEP